MCGAAVTQEVAVSGDAQEVDGARSRANDIDAASFQSGMDQEPSWFTDPMKLWIDNEKDPALARRFGLDPNGWVVASSMSEAIALIRSSAPDEIALDWDLGWGATGEDVIFAVANLYGPGRRPAPKVTFISAMDESNALLRETWQEAMVRVATPPQHP
jgi:hypothetical protein